MPLSTSEKSHQDDVKILRSKVANREDWGASLQKQRVVLICLIKAGKPLRFEELVARCKGMASRVVVRKAVTELEKAKAVKRAKLSHKHVEVVANLSNAYVLELHNIAEALRGAAEAEAKDVEGITRDVTRDLNRLRTLRGRNRKKMLTAITRVAAGSLARVLLHQIYTSTMEIKVDKGSRIFDNPAVARVWKAFPEGMAMVASLEQMTKVTEAGQNIFRQIREADSETRHIAFVEWQNEMDRRRIDERETIEKLMALNHS